MVATRSRGAYLGPLAWLALLGCGSEPSLHAGADKRMDEPMVDAGGAARVSPHDSPEAAALQPCADLADDPSHPFPMTIQAAVDRINALPRPVSIPCFVASLPRPFSIVATVNVTSAQPADGPDAPRLFIMSEGLVMSIVPGGMGRMLLEFGEVVTPDRSLKGEVKFPVEEAVSDSDPYTRVLYDANRTNCGLCHREEWPHPEIAGGYESLAFRPPLDTEMPLSDVRAVHERCDPLVSPYRCEMLTALFAFGPVEQGAFAPEVPLFY